MSKNTIYTIANELNMTPSMVSRALNPNGKVREDKRRLVLEAAKKYNFVPNAFASRLSMKTIRIGIVLKSKFDVNSSKMINGIELAYSELKDYKIEYDITVIDASERAEENCRKALKKYENYDGVIVTGMSSAAYEGMLNDFCEKNPNLVQVQAVNPNVNNLFASKHNEETASNLAVDFLYQCLKREKRKNVILFTGDISSSLHCSARQAFLKACDNVGLNVLDAIDMNDDSEYFESILPGIFEKYADITDGIYITSGLSVPLCDYIKKNNLDITLVTFDTYNEIREYLKEGIISATISQDVAGQMRRAFSTLVMYKVLSIQPEKEIYTDVSLILKSNSYQPDFG